MSARDEFTIGVLCDLHLDLRDIDDHYLGREHCAEYSRRAAVK
jgi:hypothetical protein